MLFRNSMRALSGLLLALPGSALALGLGDIHVLSPVNAPLNAQVDVVGAAPGSLGTMQARMAPPETYARYGLDYQPYMAGVQAAVVRTADGRVVIQLQSSEPAHRAQLLVELTWGEGYLVREYLIPGAER